MGCLMKEGTCWNRDAYEKNSTQRGAVIKRGTYKEEGTKSNHYSNYDSYIRYWSTKEVIHDQTWQ